MAWTEDQKKTAIASYVGANPTPESSTEIIKDIAEELEQTSNGVRMVLVQAGVYVKKDAMAAPKEGEKKGATGGGRVSKETSINALKAAIVAKGAAVDNDVLDKLTGKAAIYLLSVINA